MELKEIIEGLKEYDSATVQNAMMTMEKYDKEQIDYSSPELKSLHLENGTVVGIAVTCKVTPLYEPKDKLDWDEYYDAIDQSDLPVIGVIVDIEKNKGRGAVMGDGMALKHKVLGAVGVINGGSIRDLPGISEVGMSVWATGRVPGHGPFNLIETQTEVEVGDLLIKPGDLIVGDTDGITRVPIEIAEETLKCCKEVRDFETGVFDELKKKL
ncbi:MAG: hypothetical protein CL772_02995 [Chloroflexi bacterium]|nr:hypothetical protein [Chloroflexota bacterium]MBK90128.1 hypothetical protein [Chloroflexota bacterium]|tara:strand:- start:20794 stop:21429 length:636 start_codon:yes stop_codon:yes gene_type:complete